MQRKRSLSCGMSAARAATQAANQGVEAQLGLRLKRGSDELRLVLRLKRSSGCNLCGGSSAGRAVTQAAAQVAPQAHFAQHEPRAATQAAARSAQAQLQLRVSNCGSDGKRSSSCEAATQAQRGGCAAVFATRVLELRLKPAAPQLQLQLNVALAFAFAFILRCVAERKTQPALLRWVLLW